VAFRELHAPRRRRLRGRRPARVEPDAAAPGPVAMTRATVIAAEPFADAAAAAEWLRGCEAGGDRVAAEIEEALELVNVAVSAHRIAAQDPYVRDLVTSDAQHVRLGYGTGDEVVEGRWQDALVIPPERARRGPRRRMLSPHEEMAGMLSGRRPGGQPSEELLLRARLDLDHGRVVEAALIVRAVVEALAAEGHAAEGPAAERLAQAALAGELSEEQLQELADLVLTLERMVRRRRYAEGS